MTGAARALLGELAESPLPGARYARDVVSRRVLAIEAEAGAIDVDRLARVLHTLELDCADDSVSFEMSYCEPRLHRSRAEAIAAAYVAVSAPAAGSPAGRGAPL